MRRVLTTVAVMLAVVLFAATAAFAKKPMTGVMELQFDLCYGGPSEVNPDWIGTITIDGDEYGMAFFNIGTGKAFDVNPGGNVFFAEIWRIYEDTDFFAFDGDGCLTTFAPGDPIMWGYDKGLVNTQTSKYHMSGPIEEANGEFSAWEGRQVHMNGVIEWYPFGAPRYAPGTVRFH